MLEQKNYNEFVKHTRSIKAEIGISGIEKSIITMLKDAVMVLHKILDNFAGAEKAPENPADK